MQVQVRDGSKERIILTALLTDKAVLSQIAPKWKEGLFQSRWANLVASWCIEFFNTYADAPGKKIESLFTSWAEKNQDKNTIAIVDKFLTSVSSEYEQKGEQPSQYIIDMAGEFFNRVRLSKLLELAQGHIDMGHMDKAEEVITSYNRIEVGARNGVDLFTSEPDVRAAFVEEDTECVVEYPGALGKFFHGQLCRDSLVAIQAPEKSFKSFFLMDIGYRAATQRRRVAFFEAGDMSEKQISRRFYSRASGQPYYSHDGKWPCTVRYPVAIYPSHEKDVPTKIDYDTKEFAKRLNADDAWDACQRLISTKMKSKRSFMRLSCHSNSTINVSGIRAILQDWEREDWIPDIICIDYADILADPVGTFGDSVRDRINTTWKQLRSLAQDTHALVITATQADSDSYTKEIQDRRNFSEDKRKMSHVTSMFGINVNGEEKEQGMCRLNWIVKREGEFSSRKCVYVAQCLALCHPTVRSSF